MRLDNSISGREDLGQSPEGLAFFKSYKGPCGWMRLGRLVGTRLQDLGAMLKSQAFVLKAVVGCWPTLTKVMAQFVYFL